MYMYCVYTVTVGKEFAGECKFLHNVEAVEANNAL